jgi:hypothetical protein
MDGDAFGASAPLATAANRKKQGTVEKWNGFMRTRAEFRPQRGHMRDAHLASANDEVAL